MEFNRANVRKMKELILFTIFVLVGLWKYDVILNVIFFVLDIIFPFLLGGAIAFILNVPMNFLENKVFKKDAAAGKKIARPASLTLTILFLAGIVLIVVFVVAPQMGETFRTLAVNIQAFVPQLIDNVEKMFQDNQEATKLLSELNMDWQTIFNGVIDFFRNGAANVLDSTVSVAKNIVDSLVTFFIAFVFGCYILLQKEKLKVQMSKIFYAYLPERHVNSIMSVSSLTYQCFANFLTGQCTEALIFGGMCSVVMAILRIPYALLIGVVVAFTALIPIFGAFIGCGVGAFLILMENPIKAILFIVVFIILQQVEGNLIYPKVVGESVGLPPIWVLVAVSIGGSLMGVVGMLVFIPLVSVIYSLLRSDVYKRLRQKKIEL